MAFYSFIFTANYKRFFTRLKKVAQEEKKCFPWMVLDAGWSVFRYGMALTDYLTYKFYKRSAAERKQYIGTRTVNEFYATSVPKPISSASPRSRSSCGTSPPTPSGNLSCPRKWTSMIFSPSFSATMSSCPNPLTDWAARM